VVCFKKGDNTPTDEIKAVMTPLCGGKVVARIQAFYESGSSGGLDQPFPHQFVTPPVKAKTVSLFPLSVQGAAFEARRVLVGLPYAAQSADYIVPHRSNLLNLRHRRTRCLPP
jgi:hypothetical protein